MKTLIQSVKGTRDFYPEEMAVRAWIYGQIRQVAESFGYQEYEGPFLEKIDLYAAKSGEELVKKQSYVFTDRGGDEITLRPELTPTLARMVAQRQNELVFPLRWWSFGPFWRYEHTQKGRSREFYQWNIDLIGADNPEADAELVAISATFFRQIGLKADQVAISVNNRKLMDAEMQKLGVPVEQRGEVFHFIDKRDKMTPAAWDSYAGEIGLNDEQLSRLKDLLADKDAWKRSPEMLRFFEAIDALGVREYIRFDPGVIRGLEYYTGTVFEAYEISGQGRAIFGGGRYDNLVGDVGGEQVAAVGFAMGDVMLTVVLRDHGLLPELAINPAQVLVTVFDETRLASAFRLASQLRQAGIAVSCFPEGAKLKKQFKYADRMGYRFVLVVGPDEEAQGQVTVKDLKAGTQETLPLNGVSQAICQMLAEGAPV
jgi:histidyl-tRNA synthetase